MYDVLGVSWSAEETQIRKAYRKLAVQLHPDKNNGPGAEDAFKRVAEAVQTLTDPVQRTNYNLKLSTASNRQTSFTRPPWMQPHVPRATPPRPAQPPPRPQPQPSQRSYPLPPNYPKTSAYNVPCSSCGERIEPIATEARRAAAAAAKMEKEKARQIAEEQKVAERNKRKAERKRAAAKKRRIIEETDSEDFEVPTISYVRRTQTACLCQLDSFLGRFTELDCLVRQFLREQTYAG
ncbi:MAG: hypothetical protein SGPRY_012315 [Prymnesium sp.]